MRKASVVIGSNYGDCGKGLITDYLSNEDTIVVRHNGGSQAGHTVVTPEGKEHVFSHFGSGTFRGAKTFLSSHFVVNPMLFLKEYKILRDKGVDSPRVHIDGMAYVSTPYDLMLNQHSEKIRGNLKHGSCGVGFGETIERCDAAWKKDYPTTIVFGDFMYRRSLEERLLTIRDKYVPERCRELGFTAEQLEYWMDPNIAMNFLYDCVDMLDITRYGRMPELMTNDIVFEGAQGLMLDMDHHQFPHVTRSKTGLHNTIYLAKSFGFDKLDAYYVSRTYLTRHGAGPLRYEMRDFPYLGVEEKTNKANDHQGKFRYAYLDFNDLTQGIKDDLNQKTELEVRPHFALTCVDQSEDRVRYWHNDDRLELSAENFASNVFDEIGAKSILLSRGRTRNDISLHKPRSFDTLSL